MSRRLLRSLMALLAGAAFCAVLLWGGRTLANSRSYQLFGELVTRVETTDSVVALTFDDGPVPVYTDSVLATLADSNVPATFFVVGAGLAEHPALAQRVVNAGHELGNHSFSHQRMVLKSPGFVRRELETTDSLIRAAGQNARIHFRPPYGKRLVVLPWILSRSGRATVLWDLEPDSYPAIARDASRLTNYVVQNVRPGSIILLHVEVRSRSVARAALPRIIGALRAAGYEFVTVSELMRRGARYANGGTF